MGSPDMFTRFKTKNYFDMINGCEQPFVTKDYFPVFWIRSSGHVESSNLDLAHLLSVLQFCLTPELLE